MALDPVIPDLLPTGGLIPPIAVGASDDGGGAPAWLRLLFVTTFLPGSCILILEWAITYATATGQVAHASSLACGYASAIQRAKSQ